MFEMLWPLVLGIAIGLLLGAAAAWILAVRSRQGMNDELASARARNDVLDQQVQQFVSETRSLREQMDRTVAERETARRERAVLEEQLRAKQQQFEEQRRLLSEAEANLKSTFQALSAAALKSSNDQFMQLAEEKFKPIRELLQQHQLVVGEIEKKRETAYARLDEQIKSIAASHEKLGTETGRLVSALRRPEQRGRWGELQLRNAVELAGMSEHCDFAEQVTVQTDDGSSLRPDMIVRLPGGGLIPVDSKVAINAYLDAMQPDADRGEQMKRHARHVAEHVSRLADKRYADQFDRTPGVVVMFMPLESALVAALEVNPELHAEAMQRHVLIATPTLLVALLRAVAYGWQQEAIAANARQIADVGRELYSRLSVFAEHFSKIGEKLNQAGDAYDRAVGSLERNLLPSARRLKETQATTDAEIESPEPLQIETRAISSAELKPAARDG